MRFLRQNQYVLLFLAVLVLSSVMVLREYEARAASHVQQRENFICAHERGSGQIEQRLYQRLIQDLPDLTDRALAEDLQRSTLLLDPKKPEQDNLVWKFYISVGNELRKRAQRRLARLEQEPEFK